MLQYKHMKRIRLLYDDNCIDHKIITKIRIRIRIRIRIGIIEVTLVQYTYEYTCTYIHGSTLSIRVRHSTVQTRNDIY